MLIEGTSLTVHYYLDNIDEIRQVVLITGMIPGSIGGSIVSWYYLSFSDCRVSLPAPESTYATCRGMACKRCVLTFNLVAVLITSLATTKPSSTPILLSLLTFAAAVASFREWRYYIDGD